MVKPPFRADHVGSLLRPARLHEARAKAQADEQARDASAAAEARLSSQRAAAKERLAKAAEEAAIDIVSRLTGDSVSPQDAAAAVRSAAGS